MAIDSMLDNDWRKPIIEYLGNPIGVTERKVKYRVLSYITIGNELFKKTLEGIILKCLGESEDNFAIYEVHRGSCGSHQEDHKMKWFLL